jgi:alpha/beta superfamily hydrolase
VSNRRAALTGLLVFLSLCCSAQAGTGLYDGHPPAGRVASDNLLTTPSGRLRGVAMLIHGRAWVFVGQKTLAASEAEWFTQHGWATYDVDYRAGWDSLTDVIAAYDHLRRLVGHRAKICVQGESAGGTLAMLLAASRPSVSCVISEGGIADITALPRVASDAVNKYVFPGHLWQFSPVRIARQIRQPLLMAGASDDQVVPERQQLGEMRHVRPATETMLLAGAPTLGLGNFVHASVTTRALASFRRAELALLNGP